MARKVSKRLMAIFSTIMAFIISFLGGGPSMLGGKKASAQSKTELGGSWLTKYKIEVPTAMPDLEKKPAMKPRIERGETISEPAIKFPTAIPDLEKKPAMKPRIEKDETIIDNEVNRSSPIITTPLQKVPETLYQSEGEKNAYESWLKEHGLEDSITTFTLFRLEKIQKLLE